MKNAIRIGALAAAVAGASFAAQQQAAPAKPAGPTPAEQEAFRTVVQAVTPDARITASEDFVTKFPESLLKPYVLLGEAQSYQQKNDYEKTVIYGERALEAKPNDMVKAETMLLLAKVIAQRTREFDLDREEKLGRVEKYANGAIETVKTMPKPNPNVPDEQWDAMKNQMLSDAHEALGMDAQVRKDNDKAIEEFKAAVASSPSATTAQLRLAMAYNKAGKYDDSLAITEKLMADPNLNPQIKSFAQAERARSLQAKNGGQKPAPAAPQGGAQAAPTAPAPAPAAPPKQ